MPMDVLQDLVSKQQWLRIAFLEWFLRVEALGELDKIRVFEKEWTAETQAGDWGQRILRGISSTFTRADVDFISVRENRLRSGKVNTPMIMKQISILFADDVDSNVDQAIRLFLSRIIVEGSMASSSGSVPPEKALPEGRHQRIAPPTPPSSLSGNLTPRPLPPPRPAATLESARPPPVIDTGTPRKQNSPEAARRQGWLIQSGLV